jgi:hypothetical protein
MYSNLYKSTKFTPIESVLDIYDTNRYWMYIPGFNGYEVSNDGIIRSMKHFVKYPYGILIQKVKRGKYADSPDPLYEISDDDNKRQRIRLSQIMELAKKNQFAVYGYPRATIVTNSGSRNKYVRNSQGAYVKVYNGPNKNSIDIPPIDNTTHYAKFTIIQDGTEMPNMEYKPPEVKCPVSSINGTEFFGRKDCMTICDPETYR